MNVTPSSQHNLSAVEGCGCNGFSHLRLIHFHDRAIHPIQMRLSDRQTTALQLKFLKKCVKVVGVKTKWERINYGSK